MKKEEEKMANEFAEEQAALEQEHAAEKPVYVNVKFPPGFAHPYTLTDKTGREWNKAIVNIPPGTSANGVDLTGYSVDVFLSSFQQSQIASAEALSVGFREGEKVELFRGSGEDRESLHLDPWALTKAVKAQREDFAAQKAAERQGGAPEQDGYSLGSEQRDAAAAKDALGGGMQEHAVQAR